MNFSQALVPQNYTSEGTNKHRKIKFHQLISNPTIKRTKCLSIGRFRNVVNFLHSKHLHGLYLIISQLKQ